LSACRCFSYTAREEFGVKGCTDAARWLADLQADGLVRHVGLTNFDTRHLIEVEGDRRRPVADQA